MTEHKCQWPGCSTMVPRNRWGCPEHWVRLPMRLRNDIQATDPRGGYVTPLHTQSLKAAQRWALTHQAAVTQFQEKSRAK